MLLLESFYNREKYISPEEEIKIYYETKDLFRIWKEIIIYHSNSRITDLSREKQDVLNQIIHNLQNFIFNPNQSLSQLDRIIMVITLWGASSALPQKEIIDEVFSKTKNSLIQYFHHDLLINAYLKVGDANSAIKVIKHMFDKNHSAYFYAIMKYDVSKISNFEFNKMLTNYQQQITIKLLARGEKVNLNNVSYTDLLQLLEDVKGNIASDLLG
ncbi:gp261 [Bacillus phage G]|uniref:Gp261 n=1 Tax=Bacillus phage G TaxID=2884420 RepID=G3MA02_9CAUD|nr:gp261 [Bacillus phage G]AEO93520.1 gp261 [Bacillus phage G]